MSQHPQIQGGFLKISHLSISSYVLRRIYHAIFPLWFAYYTRIIGKEIKKNELIKFTLYVETGPKIKFAWCEKISHI